MLVIAGAANCTAHQSVGKHEVVDTVISPKARLDLRILGFAAAESSTRYVPVSCQCVRRIEGGGQEILQCRVSVTR